MDGTRLRNHPTAIIGTLVPAILIILVFGIPSLLGAKSSGKNINGATIALAIIVLGITFVTVRRYLKTTFTFGENEMVVNRDTFFKMEKRIQYSKLASINVQRGIFNRIFGTTVLLFNVNSSVNSNIPEATIVLKKNIADELRSELSAKIFKKEFTVEQDKQIESLVKVSNGDIILHGILGQPSIQAVVGLGSLVVSFFSQNVGGSITAFIIFVMTSAIPWIQTVLRYYNYRIYRVGDVITVESGLIRSYRSSFNIKKVNTVRIREPLLARMIRRSLLEAEVVGLSDSKNMPLLCPLKNRRIVRDLSAEIVPEFMFEGEPVKQPRSSLFPTIMYKVLASIASMAIGATIFIVVSRMVKMNDIAWTILSGITLIFVVAVPLLLLIHGILAYKIRQVALGEDTFYFVYGGYDRVKEFVRYDKVQMCTVSAGIIQRRFKVAQCTASFMSSMGVRGVTSGLFSADVLEQISEILLARIKDGRYDYRYYQ